MTFIMFLVVFGIVGAATLYTPTILLRVSLLILRSSKNPNLISSADRIDEFFATNGIRYETANRVSFNKRGNRWVQTVLAPLAVLWKFVALMIGMSVSAWIFDYTL